MACSPCYPSFNLSILLHPSPVFRQLRSASDPRAPSSENGYRHFLFCCFMKCFVVIKKDFLISVFDFDISYLFIISIKLHAELLICSIYVLVTSIFMFWNFKVPLSVSTVFLMSLWSSAITVRVIYILCYFLTFCHYKHQRARNLSFGDFSLAKSSHLITAVDVNSTAVSPEEMGPHSEAYTYFFYDQNYTATLFSSQLSSLG